MPRADQAANGGGVRLPQVPNRLARVYECRRINQQFPGPLEGTNNKIKTMQRQHYGLRDSEFFILKLYQLHEAKYALVG